MTRVEQENRIKMNWLKEQWNDLARRKLWIVGISGVAIIIALIAGRIFDRWDIHHPLMIFAAIIAGTDIGIRAIRALMRKQITIELLVTIAATGALIIGEYWESAAVTFLFVFGSWLEARTLNRTRSSLAGLIKLAPSTAFVEMDGEVVEMPLYDVAPGDHVQVRPGDSIPVDGVVIRGTTSINEAAITGESMPVEKSLGDQVFTGTVTQDSAITIEAQKVGSETILGKIIQRVEEAQDSKAPMQTTVERFAQWYTPAIIVLALVIYAFSRDAHLALTILVIGCPGALVIATPVAFVAGIGRAASQGVLVKGGEFLENVSKVTALALDKTGTITEGKPYLTDILTAPNVTEDEVLRVAAIAQTGSSHPLARPIMRAAEERSLNVPLSDTHRAVVGAGVVAEWGGKTISIGTRELMADQGVTFSTNGTDPVADLQADGKTVSLVALDDQLLGIVAAQDTPRESVNDLVPQLREIGVKVVAMLTGDAEPAAQAIGKQVGLSEIHARMLPEHKLEWVKQKQAEGHTVAMVGDGINDTPALAQADVSIAMGAAGSDVALETANVALMDDDPLKIVDALRISRKTRNVVRQNLVIAVATVVLLLAGVLMGEVNMAGGMLVHEASVMVVILNAMRLMRA